MNAVTDTLKFNFELEENDWLSFSLSHWKSSKPARRYVRFSLWIVPVIFIFILIAEYLKNDPDWLWVVALVISAIIWVIFYPRAIYQYTKRAMLKTIRSGDNSNLLCKHFYELTERGIQTIIPDKKTEFIQWSAIKKIVETPHYIFVYDTAVSAIIFPKKKLIHYLADLSILIERYSQVEVQDQGW